MCRCPVPVGLAQVSRYVPEALVSTEDKRFYHSFGLDPEAIARAIFARNRQGGSGLDQQIAKNLLVGAERSYARKVQEALDALAIDELFSKDEILAIYLNNMDWGTVNGRSIVGIEQASRAYFGKSAAQLNLYESAVLVGMLKGPTFYSPIRHAERSRERTAHVLQRMVDQAYIRPADRAAALKRGAQPGRLRPLDLQTVYYTSWVRRALDASHAFDGQQELRVVLGLDLRMQENAASRVQELVRLGRARGATEAALVAMTGTGLVQALVGGADFQQSQIDRATTSRRQPGSAFKPFVYLRALELGRRPTDRILDAPDANGWPRNYERRYEGTVSLSHALAHSLNAAAVRLADEIGEPGIADLAHRLGIRSPLGATPSLALGAYAVTPMELTAAYAALANGGRQVTPHGILAVLTMQGEPVEQPADESGPRVVPAADVRLLDGMLRQAVTSGTGLAANFGPTAAGKTGTTQDERDAWFVGFDMRTGLTAGIWTGNDDNRPMRGVTGSTLPAIAWNRFFRAAEERTGTAIEVARH
jgi:penicillin-binding protein 1A